MFDQVFEGFRKASESSILAQQELLKQWAEQWPAASLSAAGSAFERNSQMQRRWVESAAQSLNKHREVFEALCRAGITIAEQTAHITDAKSPDDYRQRVEQVWRKVVDTMKASSEAQLEQFKKFSDAWLEAAQEPLKGRGQAGATPTEALKS